MDWTPFTQILAIIAGIAGVNFWIWKASVNAINQMQKETHNITNGIREDAKEYGRKHDDQMQESARRFEVQQHKYDVEFQETRKLWAELLQKISNNTHTN